MVPPYSREAGSNVQNTFARLGGALGNDSLIHLNFLLPSPVLDTQEVLSMSQVDGYSILTSGGDSHAPFLPSALSASSSNSVPLPQGTGFPHTLCVLSSSLATDGHVTKLGQSEPSQNFSPWDP